jgi:hypothetical protein
MADDNDHNEQGLTVQQLEEAESCIVKLVQSEAFKEELKTLNNAKGKPVSKTSSLNRLDPFVDDRVVLRVGGRVQKGDFAFGIKHPIILPRKCHVTQLIIRYFHERIKHQERSITTNEIRSNDY